MSEEIAAPERRTYQTPSQHPLLALFHFYGINPHEQDRVRPNDQNYFIPIKLALGCPWRNKVTLFRNGEVRFENQVIELNPFLKQSFYPANITDRLYLRFGNWDHEPTRRRLCAELELPDKLIAHFDRNLLPMVTVPQKIESPNPTDQARQEIMRTIFNPSLRERIFRGRRNGVIRYSDLPEIGSTQFITGQLNAMRCINRVGDLYQITPLSELAEYYDLMDPMCQSCQLVSLCSKAQTRAVKAMRSQSEMLADLEISYRGSIINSLGELIPNNFVAV